ncbi:NAD(P)-dependent alcohol dehydrogenase [Cellulomonas humilata]|uniref:NADPH:quinone reductase-like Zn-dependent oxidoreductase n=1 Tax=Cellulomonas humilata TaxID=144055 RepID=A0ABU0EAC2_9CELL|nr:NAD(P)-dependent alcohol dehydrogenase [Cellulomonas humilata]MDQ0372038.1 NADPH:quinone reductase-like Zn-dependent oxidoreductase [Cellulomonas humilata]
MKAIVQTRYGSPDTCTLEDVDDPVPASGEVTVRIRAASLNARDWHLMRGDPYLARLAPGFGLRAPTLRIRGSDFAGTVEAVGSDVTRLHVGDEVYGLRDGALAEYVCAPESLVTRKPSNLTFEQAAAMPMAGMTALQGLQGRVGAGQRILINGASGGVGTFAVQLAHAWGAEVTAVCSTRNVDLVRSLGADHVVDYTRDDALRAGHRYDVLFDLVANRSLRDLRRALTPTGTLILSGGGVFDGGSVLGPIGLLLRSKLTAPFVGQEVVALSTKPGAEHLDTLRDLAEAGTIVPAIDRTYPLPAAADALRYLESEHARAKVVVTI